LCKNEKKPVYAKIREIRIVAKVGGTFSSPSPNLPVKPTKKRRSQKGSGETILPIGLGHTFELVLFLFMQNDQFDGPWQ